MTINQIIMYIMCFGVLLGGVDRVLGNRFGFGDKFENGFRMLGPVGLSMAGIICLAPLLSGTLGIIVTPFCRTLRIDPSIFGSVLAIDMGGYLMSMDLAIDPTMGKFSGIIVSSIFGCTVVYSIPVGLGFLCPEDRPLFTKGILLGFVAMPFGIIAGGLALGLGIGAILWNTLPVLLISLLLSIGVIRKPELMQKGFQGFARLMQIIATVGLTLGAVTHLSGIQLIPSMTALQTAMQTVSAICIVMLGSMPLAELIQRIMKKPFSWISRHTGLNGASTTGLLLGLVTATPALAMIPQMDRRGKVVISSCLVSCVCVLGAHVAFTMNAEPEMVPALLVAKITGGIIAAAISLYATRSEK